MINVSRAIEILEEALSGTSSKSKNTLIKDAIKCLKTNIPVEEPKLYTGDEGEENNVQDGQI